VRARMLTSLAAAAGGCAVTLSAMTVWLWLTRPLMLADALGEGGPASLASAVLRALADALGSLARYL
jgi:hypothetical protein